jgi:hypothetical protein
VDHLVAADKHIDLFEYALQRIIKRHLEPSFRRVKRPAAQYYSIGPLLAPCGELLSCLAHWGADDTNEAQRAFAKGAETIAAGASVELTPSDRCGLQVVDNALDRLAAASPKVKRQVLSACVACVGADGQVTVAEAELLRSVADSLDCPIPPFLPTAA